MDQQFENLNENPIEQINHTLPETNMVHSILSVVFGSILIFTCYLSILGIPSLVLGILGLVNGSNVPNFYSSNNFELAESSAKNARKFGKIGLILSIIGLSLLVLVIVLGFIFFAFDIQSPTSINFPSITSQR